MHYDAYLRPQRQSHHDRPVIDGRDGHAGHAGHVGLSGHSGLDASAADRMARAREAVAAAGVTTGTVVERIRRAEEGMVQVADIAHETDDRAERHTILELNETLFTLAQALRSSRITEDYAAVGWG